MRKYDSKNKRNIGIVLVICLLILIVFALFIKRVSDLDKKEYIIDVNSVLYDRDKNKIILDGTGTLKVKWSGAYYLKYQEEEIPLTKQVVVYNQASKIISLYGTIYKINEDESVDTLKDETIVEDTVVPKFYKLADRKYLLIASDIKNEKGTFTANDYLIVELDKLGNATLTNNKINMKTLTETKLITSAYSFDIANEILTFGDREIDLKKIIGSTNEYVANKESNTGNDGESATGESTGDASSNGGTGDNGNENQGGDASSEEGSGGVSSITDNRVYQDKNFSIIRNTVGTNYLSIDYSIYDPKSEYKNIFLEIENDVTKEVETYYLARNGSNLKISGLLPNTKYNLVYKYSYLDKDLNVLYDSFDTNYSISTILPETTIAVTKLTNTTLSYTLSESDALMYSAVVELYVDDNYITSYTFNSDSATSSYYGTFDISSIENIGYITLKCTSITYASGKVDTDFVTRVKY